MKIIRRIFVCLTICALAVFAYAKLMQRVGSGNPPEMAAKDLQADRIVVDKSDRQLTLFRDGTPIRVYGISLGGNPLGHKQQEGDEKTPEGDYIIDWRNPNSIAHLSLHISYPNPEDKEKAAARGVSAGGNIMIHGILNGWGWVAGLHRYWDWTNGCIAVTDAEMREIWSLVPNGTPITIDG